MKNQPKGYIFFDIGCKNMQVCNAETAGVFRATFIDFFSSNNTRPTAVRYDFIEANLRSKLRALKIPNFIKDPGQGF